MPDGSTKTKKTQQYRVQSEKHTQIRQKKLKAKQ